MNVLSGTCTCINCGLVTDNICRQGIRKGITGMLLFHCPSDLCVTHVNHVTDVGCGLGCIFLHKCDVFEVRLSSTCNALMWQAMN